MPSLAFRPYRSGQSRLKQGRMAERPGGINNVFQCGCFVVVSNYLGINEWGINEWGINERSPNSL